MSWSTRSSRTGSRSGASDRAARLAAAVVLLLAVAHGASAATVEAPPSFYLRDGDRVVFYGDSITEQRYYTDLVETFVVTRFPAMRVEFSNAGWSGEWIVGGGGGKVDERLRRDVFDRKPTVITVMLGMNDASYTAFDPAIFDVYRKGYRHFLDSVATALPKARVTLLRPSPFDEITPLGEYRPVPPKIEGGYNAVVARYGAFVGELARERNLTVVDMNRPVIDAVRRAIETAPDEAGAFIPDRIHPERPGALLMAAELMEAWRAPSAVTEVEIDARARKVAVARNTSVTALVAGETLSWTQTDGALPFPVDYQNKAVAAAARIGRVAERLNAQPLRVVGLAEARYALSIDGTVVGTFTREELAAGVDLATRRTPMVEQAFAVHLLTTKHTRLQIFRWQEIQVGLDGHAAAEAARAVAALDALESRLVAEQRETARPRPRRYELRPA